MALTKKDIYKQTVKSLKVTNISINGSFNTKINLEKVSAETNFFKRLYLLSALKCKLFKGSDGKWHTRQDMRKREGEVCFTVLIFSSGNFICAGVRDKEIGPAFDIIREELRKVGYKTSLKWQIQNINFTGSFPTKIDMSVFVRKTFENIEYDPDEFPGGRYHYPSKKARTLTFFDTGKFIISGLRYQSVETAYAMAKKIVKAFVDTAPRKAFVTFPPD